MDFPEAMAQYWKLRAQHEAGGLSDEEFEVAVGDLTVVDSQGDAWQIGVTTGRWYRYDGHTWVEGFPTLPKEGAQEAPSAPASERASWAPRARPASLGGGEPSRITLPPGWEEAPAVRAGRRDAARRVETPSEPRVPVVGIFIGLLVICFLLAACVAVVLLTNPDLLSG